MVVLAKFELPCASTASSSQRTLGSFSWRRAPPLRAWPCRCDLLTQPRAADSWACSAPTWEPRELQLNWERTSS